MSSSHLTRYGPSHRIRYPCTTQWHCTLHLKIGVGCPAPWKFENIHNSSTTCGLLKSTLICFCDDNPICAPRCAFFVRSRLLLNWKIYFHNWDIIIFYISIIISFHLIICRTDKHVFTLFLGTDIETFYNFIIKLKLVFHCQLGRKEFPEISGICGAGNQQFAVK